MSDVKSGRTLLERWKAGDQLSADDLLRALVYAQAIRDPQEQQLDLAEREARASLTRGES